MSLSKNKIFRKNIDEAGNEVYVIKTPCEFILREEEVRFLKSMYLIDEEVGGYISFKETLDNEKLILTSCKIFPLSNDYDSHPKRRKGRSKKNTYWTKSENRIKARKEIFQENNIPISFHTHPTNGANIIEQLINFSGQREPSEQDLVASKTTIKFKNGEELLLPDALIIGNPIDKGNIFIGFYDGFIAPINFEKEKNEVMKDKLKTVIESIFSSDSSDLSKREIISLVSGAIFFLIFIWKFSKYSMPVIITLLGIVSLKLTDNEEDAKYYCQLNNGKARIQIP